MSQISTKKITLTGVQKPFLERYKSLTKLYSEIGDCEPMSFEETKDWFDKYKNGSEKEKEEAFDKICKHNMKLVISMARQYCSTQDNLMDLIQEGNVGLVAAIEKYDANIGSSFQAHAMFHIRRYINLFKNNTTGIIQKTNRSKTAHTVHTITSNMTQKLERTPYPEEVLDEYNKHNKNKKIKDSGDFVNVEYVYIDNFETTTGDINDMGSFLDFNNQTRSENGYLREIEAEHNHKTVKALLETLNPKERKAITMYYGLEDGVESTLSMIGAELGVTSERARQLCSHAIEKMSTKAKEYAYAI